MKDLLTHSFGTILADPPWDYSCKTPTISVRPHVLRGENSGSVEHYYATLSLADIKAVPVAEMSAPNSCLFLWATVPLLPEAFAVMQAWGWKYKTMLSWHKTNGKGMGFWFRGVTEHLLLGVRGDIKAFRSQQKNLIECKVARHSAKPQQVHELIESVSPGPRLELFGRLNRPGWRVWGNQVKNDLLSCAAQKKEG